MNLVFLVGGYFPRFSATGNCIAQIANVMVKTHDIENVTVISEKKVF